MNLQCFIGVVHLNLWISWLYFIFQIPNTFFLGQFQLSYFLTSHYCICNMYIYVLRYGTNKINSNEGDRYLLWGSRTTRGYGRGHRSRKRPRRKVAPKMRVPKPLPEATTIGAPEDYASGGIGTQPPLPQLFPGRSSIKKLKKSTTTSPDKWVLQDADKWMITTWLFETWQRVGGKSVSIVSRIVALDNMVELGFTILNGAIDNPTLMSLLIFKKTSGSNGFNC